MQPNGSHACEGGCGKSVSANKRKCLECIDREIDFHMKVAAFKGESLGIEQPDAYSGNA